MLLLIWVGASFICIVSELMSVVTVVFFFLGSQMCYCCSCPNWLGTFVAGATVWARCGSTSASPSWSNTLVFPLAGEWLSHASKHLHFMCQSISESTDAGVCFALYQDWALGVLHMKIICAVTMMGPNWWLKGALEQVRHQFYYIQLCLVPIQLPRITQTGWKRYSLPTQTSLWLAT